jgi:hypothetical protein
MPGPGGRVGLGGIFFPSNLSSEMWELGPDTEELGYVLIIEYQYLISGTIHL